MSIQIFVAVKLILVRDHKIKCIFLAYGMDFVLLGYEQKQCLQ